MKQPSCSGAAGSGAGRVPEAALDRPRVRPPSRRKAWLALATAALSAFAIGRASVAAGIAHDAGSRGNAAGEHDVRPRYDAAGRLVRPRDVLEWVLVGSSVGMGYAERERGGPEPGYFHQVYLEPGAFRRFSQTGEFADGAMLALVVRAPEAGAPPARAGHAAGGLAAMEVAVKDVERFAGHWAYFDFTADAGTLRESAAPFPPAACQACHARHAARDNVFLQFYPVLREVDIARR